jgi:HSP90 family molecular chaperone
MAAAKFFKSQYKKFIKEYGQSLKLGAIEDDANRSKIAKLLRFETTKSDSEQISLDRYVQNMPENQKQIYYMCGDSKEVMLKSPSMGIFKRKNIEVLLLTDVALDESVIGKMQDFEGKKFVSITKEDVQLPDETEEEKKRHEKLVKYYKPLTEFWTKSLKDLTESGAMKNSGMKVDSVVISKRLVDNTPCTIVAGQYGYSAQQERMMRAQGQQNSQQAMMMGMMGGKKLEINPNHPVVHDLLKKVNANAGDARDEEVTKQITDVAETLFQTAIVESGYEMQDPSDWISKLHRMMSKNMGVDPEAGAVEIELPEEEEVKEAESEEAEEVEEVDASEEIEEEVAQEAEASTLNAEEEKPAEEEL